MDDLFSAGAALQEDPEKVKFKAERIDALEQTINGLKQEFIRAIESIL